MDLYRADPQIFDMNSVYAPADYEKAESRLGASLYGEIQ